MIFVVCPLDTSMTTNMGMTVISTSKMQLPKLISTSSSTYPLLTIGSVSDTTTEDWIYDFNDTKLRNTCKGHTFASVYMTLINTYMI